MAKEDFLVDEGSAFGRRRSNTSTTAATPEEVQAAIDAASAELGVDRAIPNEAAANLFAPVGGTGLSENPSTGDQNYFVNQGFTPGRIPEKYQKLYGNDPDIIGWKLEPTGDGGFRLAVARGQGDEDGGLQFQTYGAAFKEDAKGNPVGYVPSTFGSNASGLSTTTLKTPEQLAADATAAANQAQRQSAYDLLDSQFKQYGLESLVTPLKDLITSGASPSEFTIKLRETPQYKQRFAANDMRIANGFAAIDEATYLALEDKYQSLMQNYGLPPQYYAKGELGTQEGFQKLIAGNVDPITAEERILEGKKLTDSTKQTLDAAKKFYPSLTDGDILAYTLDPKNALSDIKRKVTAAEIGGAQMGAGLQATATGAEALAGAGVTGAKYLQAAPFIAEAAQRGSELSSFYGQQPYNQQTAETEALDLAGNALAAKQRKKLSALEQASFSGSSGVGALGRDKKAYGMTEGQTGLY